MEEVNDMSCTHCFPEVRTEKRLKPCGTNAGFSRHRYYGEEPCEACRSARNLYNRKWQSSNEKTKARIVARARALGSLSRAFAQQFVRNMDGNSRTRALVLLSQQYPYTFRRMVNRERALLGLEEVCTPVLYRPTVAKEEKL